ncbi:hypothetical protein DTO271G3_4466 [Paecilomyces variotii]|nr:hypothetical protein DTO271G3_4466 [Paecilomyces variotii]
MACGQLAARKKTAAIRQFQRLPVRDRLLQLLEILISSRLRAIPSLQHVPGSGYSRHPQLSPDNTASIHHSQTTDISGVLLELNPRSMGQLNHTFSRPSF